MTYPWVEAFLMLVSLLFFCFHTAGSMSLMRLGRIRHGLDPSQFCSQLANITKKNSGGNR